MTFETFKIAYVAIGALSAAAIWLLRKNRDDLLSLLLMSSVMGLFLMAFYFDVKEDRIHDAELFGYLLTGLTHVQDIVLTATSSSGELFLSQLAFDYDQRKMEVDLSGYSSSA